MTRWLTDVLLFSLPTITVVLLWLSPWGDRRG